MTVSLTARQRANRPVEPRFVSHRPGGGSRRRRRRQRPVGVAHRRRCGIRRRPTGCTGSRPYSSSDQQRSNAQHVFAAKVETQGQEHVQSEHAAVSGQPRCQSAKEETETEGQAEGRPRARPGDGRLCCFA